MREPITWQEILLYIGGSLFLALCAWLADRNGRDR